MKFHTTSTHILSGGKSSPLKVDVCNGDLGWWLPRNGEKLLAELHRDHSGIFKMKSIARSYIWWPGLDKSIERVAKSCLECQAVKNSPPVAPLHPWVWPSRVFQPVHIDFAGPFQGAMFLVAVDAYSKWPEVFIMQTTTVTKTIEHLHHMVSLYGLPEQIVSDNGPVYFMKRNGVKHTRSAPMDLQNDLSSH